MERLTRKLLLKAIAWSLENIILVKLIRLNQKEGTAEEGSRLQWEVKGEAMPLLQTLERAGLVEKTYDNAW